jgi:hypothetical protein
LELWNDRITLHRIQAGGKSMIELSNYRIIDLSHELIPGERRIDGRYLHGEPLFGRPIEVQEFIIALPVKLRRTTASWTRAIALEEV